MSIALDADLTETVNRLLREDERLLPAAALVGQVAVLYREPKPEPEAPPADKPAKGKKSPPPHADGTPSTSSAPAESGEVTAPPPGPPATPSPWHMVAVLAKADGLAKFPPDLFPEVAEDLRLDADGNLTPEARLAEMNGGKILAKITVDGTLWEKLDGAGQRAALVHALRGLRHKSRASDDADIAVIEKPPIRCWPDTAAESQELMAALGPDGAEGAALTGALASSDIGENLEEAVAKFRRLIDAGQDLSDHLRVLDYASARLVELYEEVRRQGEPSDNGPSADADMMEAA